MDNLICCKCKGTGDLTESHYPYFVHISRDDCIAYLNKRLEAIETILK